MARCRWPRSAASCPRGSRRSVDARVTLCGGTGGIGRHVREQARAAGHEVLLLARDPTALSPVGPGERLVKGEIGNIEGVEEAVTGADAVVSAVGPTSNTAEQVALFEDYARALVAAMERHALRRLIALSGAAVTAPGERKRFGDRVASVVVGRVVRHVVLAEQRELDVIAASPLDRTAPGPPRVVDGPLTCSYGVGDFSIRPRSRISQADLAHFMVAQLTDDRYLRQAPSISY
ncbi:MAG TPA: NAD(P)H-binding protein [Candidatus Caenarcaniphilales bacterium]|nr:NAD(P)H-binding protein [Candidatus Caenarcaniphilales bacterium]